MPSRIRPVTFAHELLHVVSAKCCENVSLAPAGVAALREQTCFSQRWALGLQLSFEHRAAPLSPLQPENAPRNKCKRSMKKQIYREHNNGLNFPWLFFFFFFAISHFHIMFSKQTRASRSRMHEVATVGGAWGEVGAGNAPLRCGAGPDGASHAEPRTRWEGKEGKSVFLPYVPSMVHEEERKHKTEGKAVIATSFLLRNCLQQRWSMKEKQAAVLTGAASFAIITKENKKGKKMQRSSKKCLFGKNVSEKRLFFSFLPN